MAKKRSNEEGSVRRMKSGRWRGEIMDGYTPEGKKNIVSFSASTKGEVLEKIRAYRGLQERQIHLSKTLTLAQWADSWYADYRSQVQPSTYSSYRYTLNIIKGQLGGKKLCDVLPMHINQMMDQLVDKGYSLSQISKCRAMLIQFFDSADNNGLIAQNPARKAKVIRDRDGSLALPRAQKDAFTEAEIQLLRKKLPGDLLGNSIMAMLGSGMRVQELLALTPEDIAEDGSSVLISKAIKMVDGIPTLGPPKSRSSNRTIPIPEAYREYARFLREHGGPQLVWSPPGQGTYYSVGSFRQRYYRALTGIEGVRKLSPHCCRHTYVTQLQAKGVSLELIARLTGHSSVSTTQHYAHTTTETLSNAVSVLI